MITIRKSSDRGKTSLGWLNSLHTFSFGDYYDPAYQEFGHLRVINEDRVEPGQGFARHGHQNMEIISYVIQGTMEHKDSLGNGSIIKPGEIQRMSAGTGVQHSEFNHAKNEPLHFLQIWIIPDKTGINPSYEQKAIPKLTNEWVLLADSNGGADIVKVHQDVQIYAGYLTPGHSLEYAVAPGRKIWVQVVSGEIRLNQETLLAGDGASLVDEERVDVACLSDAELLMFDLR